MDTSPLLTAILIIGENRERPVQALASLLDQSLIEQMEILVIETMPDSVAPLGGSAHPQVRVVRFGPGLASGRVRAEAVRLAQAPIVAFLEEHAWAFPGWAEEIVRAHEGPWAAISPEFHVANEGLGLADASAVAYYPLWSPPALGGESDWLPSHDTTYKRDILLAYGDQLEVLIFPEVLLHWKLREDGYGLYIEPRIKIKHYYETELSTICRGCFVAGRAFLVHRPVVFHWPLWKRAARLLISPLLPVYRLIDLYRVIGAKRPDRLPVLRRHLLPVFVFFVAGVAGEVAGMILGKGDADVIYLRQQLSDKRLLSSDFAT